MYSYGTANFLCYNTSQSALAITYSCCLVTACLSSGIHDHEDNNNAYAEQASVTIVSLPRGYTPGGGSNSSSRFRLLSGNVESSLEDSGSDSDTCNSLFEDDQNSSSILFLSIVAAGLLEFTSVEVGGPSLFVSDIESDSTCR